MRRGLLAGLLAAGLSAGLSACDECAGTPSCNNPPRMSVGGQFIEHKSGATVGGVRIEFVRKSGVLTTSDTARAVSDDNGFFQLRLDGHDDGAIVGDLVVTPPAPHPPYTVEDVSFQTSRRRAEGLFLGRLVVNPYLVFVGEVYDRFTGALVPNVTVTLRRRDGGLVDPSEATFTTDENARFAWIDPPVLQFGPMETEFELTAPGYPRTFRIVRDIELQYKDGVINFMRLPLGMGISYWGVTWRRGTGERLPGVKVTFRRTGGIGVTPETYETTADANGVFFISLSPQTQGSVFGELTITPPASASYPPHVIPELELEASDDDLPGELGIVGYGTQAYLTAHFRYRSTGLPVTAPILGEVRRVGGLETMADPADRGWRALTEEGELIYSVGTSDTGTVLFDIVAMLPPPFVAETLKAVPIASRYSDDPVELGTFRVGSWYPWRGLLRDAVTDAPVAGASVTFRRTSGARVVDDPFTTTSATDGSFPVSPVPLERGTLSGELTVRTSGAYRDTTVTGVQIFTSEDDTVRALLTVRLRRP